MKMDVSCSKDVICFIIILICTCLISIPLFHGAIIPDQGDLYCAFIKLNAMYQSWVYGSWTGRWVPDIFYGYGYPIFNYYPPLFFYLGAVLGFLLGNIVLAFNMAIFLCLFFSGVAMYLFAREFWGRCGALLSAVLYLFAPFHIVQLYVLGWCAQLLALIFFPLVLWGVYRLHHSPSWARGIFLAVSVAGLSLSHNCQTMLFLPVVFVYMVYLEFTGPCPNRPVSFASKVGAMFLGLGISAYFWVPAMLEKKDIYIEKCITGWFDFHAHYIKLSQLFFSPWGYDVSTPGQGFSFQIGWPHLICCLTFLLMAPWLWKEKKESVRMAVFSLLIAGCAVFMALKPSVLIWEHIPLLWYVQFPWRFLTIISFFFSFVGGGVLLIQHRKCRFILGGLLVIVSVLGTIQHCHPMQFAVVNGKDPAKFLYESTPLDNMELLPIGVQKMCPLRPGQKLGYWKGKIDIFNEKVTGGDHHYGVLAYEPTLAVFYSFYFPGWEVYVDGQKVDIITDNIYGLIMFPLAPGTHTVWVHFSSTPVRDMAGMVSDASVFILLVLMGLSVFGRYKKALSRGIKNS